METRIDIVRYPNLASNIIDNIPVDEIFSEDILFELSRTMYEEFVKIVSLGKTTVRFEVG